LRGGLSRDSYSVTALNNSAMAMAENIVTSPGSTLLSKADRVLP
jgi:hypothetical protein